MHRDPVAGRCQRVDDGRADAAAAPGYQAAGAHPRDVTGQAPRVDGERWG
jgi:hypothetical protein